MNSSLTVDQQSKSADNRKFGLLDVMIIIVAVASALAAIRLFLKDEEIAFYTNDRTLGPNYFYIAIHAVPLLAALSPAILIMRLRRPRPTIRDLSGQPGAVAMAAVTAGILIDAIPYLLLRFRLGVFGPMTLFHSMQGLFNQGGQFVALAWFLLRWSGNWRPEPSWIDRVGRTMGAVWIVAGVAYLLLYEIP